MSEDIIRYDLIVQEALLGVVRKALRIAAQEGLPGDHHFFITFKTTAPGVQLSKRMKAQYPDEMTIVLQHQFWDLMVTDGHFEVGLSFKNIPEKLSIPFKAITGFADPSVQFALRFDLDSGERAATEAPQDNSEGVGAPRSLAPASGQADEPAAQNRAPAPARRGAPAKGQRGGAQTNTGQGDAGEAGESQADQADAKNADGKNADSKNADSKNADAGKVVSIDAFRKK